jgi:outer membrane protein assembly factor BamB
LRSWPEKGPEVLWTAAVGRGYGGPVVKDGKVYLLDRDDKVGDNLRCLDLSNGKELWHFGYDAPGTVMFPGSRSVPIVDGDKVYSCGHNGDLYCIDTKTHKPVWNKNVWKDFGGERLPMWAITQCPLVYGDLLIVASQAPQAGVVAYERLTGDVKWKTPPLGLISYASPANCFGDYYTRKGLDIKLRELTTLSILIALGGVESQIKGHIQGNVNVGNDRSVLMDLITQLLPWVG